MAARVTPLLALHPAEVCDLVYRHAAPDDPAERAEFDAELERPGVTEATRRLRQVVDAL